MLEKLVPIPPEFYDDHKDDDLITGKGTIFPFAVFLYFMQWAAFLGFILFYWYHPSSQVTQSKMENNYDYGKASGWNCTPLLNDPFYKSRMNYETCKAIMIKPKLDDIKTMKINIDPDCIETDDNNCTQATAFRFMPFKGSEGLLGRRGVVQPGSLIENTFDSTNTDAIKAELKKIFEPLAGLTRCSAFGMHWKNKGGWGVSRVNKLASFDIFVDQMKKKAAPAAPAASPGSPGSPGGTPPGSGNTACCGSGAGPGPCVGAFTADCEVCANNVDAACASDPCNGGPAGLAAQFCAPSGRRRSSSRRRLHFGGACNPACTMEQEMNGMCFMCHDDVSAAPSACADCGAFELGADGFYDFSNAPALGATQMYGPGGEVIDLTSLSDYAWFEEGAEYEPCTISKEETLTMFEKYLTTHDPCLWAQHNSPYMCTKSGPPAPSAVFSLAYANALLAYSIFSAVCVQIFFASSKKKKAAEAEAAATETPATVHPAPGELKVGP
jgi:hypothetical protein